MLSPLSKKHNMHVENCFFLRVACQERFLSLERDLQHKRKGTKNPLLGVQHRGSPGDFFSSSIFLLQRLVFFSINTSLDFLWIPLDTVKVKKIITKGKNTYDCSKFPLHKNFKLVLEEYGTNQTYPEISSRFQFFIQEIPTSIESFKAFKKFQGCWIYSSKNW